MTQIIQWNCRGYSSNYEDCISLIKDYNPKVLLLQETMLGNLKPKPPSGYSLHVSTTAGRPIPGDGLAFLIRNGIPYKPCPLQTNLQALAFQIKCTRLYTICNIYLSHHENITIQQLINLYHQLPPPVIIAGDFNAKHLLWGNTLSDRRGHIVESFLNQSPLILLNTGDPTHFHLQSGVSTAIDLVVVVVGTLRQSGAIRVKREKREEYRKGGGKERLPRDRKRWRKGKKGGER